MPAASRSSSFGFLLVAAIAAIATTDAYDIGCIYPPDATRDLFIVRRNVFWSLIQEDSVETPMVIHKSHEITMCAATCVALHTPGVNDPLSLEPTPFTVPEFGQNGYSMIMCMAQCNAYMAFNAKSWARTMRRKHGFVVELPEDRPDIRDAVEECGASDDDFGTGACAEIENIISSEGYHPYTIGHYIGNTITRYFDDDGWNRNGALQHSPNQADPVPCSGSCRKFQDTVGYAPRPDPRITQPYVNNSTKYECTGDCRRWQPLQEGDAKGNLLQQEFVVPHIGTQANTYLREPRLTLDDPGYDLYEESLLVIEELRVTSRNQKRKDQVELFDNKLMVRRQIQEAILNQFAETREMSFQEYMLWLAGISTAEHDAVVQAWHEKVAHDLVRPTTYIKYWNDDVLFTYGGDRGANSPIHINARDFEAIVRVMPHAEYPSGSSCLCTAYMEYTDEYLTQEFGRSITNFRDTIFNHLYADMEDLRDVCGASRLWGGMHFVASIEAGEQVCSGLGTLGVEWVGTYRNNATFPNMWYRGDSRPQCGEDR
eukprot:CAMPEP_0197179490 /NCGR_PEP_ID=MMETSP1423-20130617/4414_1 /TAXON_ID=476441 /ORGANISM="Pseudo-nitzschia heimii, Strain UNC1101" /LENGTH=541 /DNA_ID=CAMNT_0042629401 /DNA_START=66 /DNA_END=1691 /DNA_ORIENTATION=-